MSDWDITADPVHPEAAINWFRSRVPVTDEEFEALEDRAADLAFTVAGASQLDVVTDIWRAIDRAVSSGTTLDDFKREVGAELEAAWGAPDGARLENIFRTNAMTAYGAGRWQAIRSPQIRKSRPFLRFNAVLDSRTTPICSHLGDPAVVRPSDDPYWESHTPPLHFMCRSELETLTPEEADEAGGETDHAPEIEPISGFGDASRFGRWRPDLDGVPPEIAAIYQARLSRAEAELGPRGPSMPIAPPAAAAPTPPARPPQLVALEQAERKLVPRKTERTVVIDPAGIEVLAKSGTKNYVKFTHEEVTKMRGNAVTHNHPRGTSLSPEDVLLAADSGATEIRAIGRSAVDGKARLYRMERPDAGWPARHALMTEIQLAAREVTEDLRPRVVSGELTPEQADLAHWTTIWERVARRLGLRYTVTEVSE